MKSGRTNSIKIAVVVAVECWRLDFGHCSDCSTRGWGERTYIQNRLLVAHRGAAHLKTVIMLISIISMFPSFSCTSHCVSLFGQTSPRASLRFLFVSMCSVALTKNWHEIDQQVEWPPVISIARPFCGIVVEQRYFVHFNAIIAFDALFEWSASAKCRRLK